MKRVKVRSLRIEQGGDGDRTPENARQGELLARVRDSPRHVSIGAERVDLHPPDLVEAHDPDLARPGAKKLFDLVLQFVLVLPGVGVLDGEGRCRGRPTILRGAGRHRHVRGAHSALIELKADLDATGLNERVRADHRSADRLRATAALPRGQTVDRVAVVELVLSAAGQILGLEGSRTQNHAVARIAHG